MALQQQAGRRGRGRPPKTGGEVKRSKVFMRMRPSVKAALDAEAREAGRSLSEEIEARLEASLRGERSLDERLDDIYGRHAAELMKLIGRILRGSPAWAGVSAEDEWLNHPIAYTMAERQIRRMLERLRPPDAPPSIPGGTPESHADRLLLALASTDPNVVSASWAATVRERLGSRMTDRIFDAGQRIDREPRGEG